MHFSKKSMPHQQLTSKSKQLSPTEATELKQLSSTELKRLHRKWRQRGYCRLALVLERVQTPFNIGAIVRAAAIQRVEHMYLVSATTPDASKAAKIAMGTARYVTWSNFDSTAQAILQARNDGYKLVGLELTSCSEPLYQIDLTCAVALILGHEDQGLSTTALAMCDAVGFIPQLSKVGSMNVASAAAIAIYEARRQSWTREESSK